MKFHGTYRMPLAVLFVIIVGICSLSARTLFKVEPIKLEEISDAERVMVLQCAKAFVRYNLSDERSAWCSNIINKVATRFCVNGDFHIFSHKFTDFNAVVVPFSAFTGYAGVTNKFAAIGFMRKSNDEPCGFTVYMNLDTGRIGVDCPQSRVIYHLEDVIGKAYRTKQYEASYRLWFTKLRMIELKEVGCDVRAEDEIEVEIEE